jgi:alpha-galactosidase
MTFHVRLLFPFAVVVGLCGASPAQEATAVCLDTLWSFTPGDDPDFSKAAFDDSGWKKLRVDKIWEEQGFDPLDRYAWYRVKVTIPRELQRQSYLKDSLLFFLGKINNFDQTFLNGKILGINGKVVPADTPLDTSFVTAPMELWNMERHYALHVDDPRIRWDDENVIAIRVFDQGGQGGLWSGGQHIRMLRLQDYLTLKPSSSRSAVSQRPSP